MIVALMKSTKNNWLIFNCFLLLVLCFLIACIPNVVPKSRPESKKTPVSEEITESMPVAGMVTDVVDGTIIKVTVSGTDYTVRYIGIYTLVPYQHIKPLEYYAERCYEKNNELVKGKPVRLEKDISDSDKSGYLLRYVWVEDTMVNAELVRQGYAMVMGSPPDIKYHDTLVKLQLEAQNEGRGLWAEEKESLSKTPVLQEYVGNIATKVFHYPGCELVENIRPAEVIIFMSIDKAYELDYKPCKVCNPR